MCIGVSQKDRGLVGSNPSQGIINFFHEFRVQCTCVWAAYLYQTQGASQNFNLFEEIPTASREYRLTSLTSSWSFLWAKWCSSFQTLLRKPGWSTTQGLLLCWFYILRKILETCVSMIFRDKWNGARVILQKCPWKPIHRKLGYYTAHSIMFSKFCATYYLNISMWF